VVACLWLAARVVPAADAAPDSDLRWLLGGELSASVAERDRGYYNFQEYDQDVLRRVRARLTMEVRLGRRLALLGEVRHVNADQPRVYALYVRLRPWPDLPFDVQAGQVPPVFGAYPRRSYTSDSTLIGEPLGYQYLLSLRPDAAPATVTDLLAMRGRGWSARYPLGATDAHTGFAPVCTLRWDTGVQARFRRGPFELAASVTQGSPANPRVKDDNGSKALAARLAWRPRPGLIAGVSAAEGRYLTADVEREVGRGPRRQRVFGADLEYSYGRWRVRAEGFTTAWDLPVADPAVPDRPLGAWTGLAELRVKLLPGLSAAARFDRLAFGDIPGASDAHTPWELAVTRAEGGLAYTPHRQVVLKAAYQRNRRGGSRVPGQSFVVGQVLLWF
jgi:hypothetical protein